MPGQGRTGRGVGGVQCTPLVSDCKWCWTVNLKKEGIRGKQKRKRMGKRKRGGKYRKREKEKGKGKSEKVIVCVFENKWSLTDQRINGPTYRE